MRISWYFPFKTEARNIESWAQTWRIKLNVKKRKLRCVTRKRHPLAAEYSIDHRVLEYVSSWKDVGVTASCDLTWTAHIHDQITKANRMLGLLKRSPANGLVRSNLADASSLESRNYHSVRGTRKNSTEGNNVYNGVALWRRNFSEENSPHGSQPLCYWHEYLHILFLFKAARGFIVIDADHST